jgi:quinohemoprotein amine dehydrogenase
MRVLCVWVFSLILLCPSQSVAQQRRNNPRAGAEEASDTEKQQEEIDSGIPITSEVVKKSCSPCHTTDEKGRMSRISWRRATPEGWEISIRRMIGLNGMQLEPEAAREVMKYLATNLGLAPEEAKAAAFETEHRMIEYKYADKDVADVCMRCHSMGRVISQRRSKGEWELLISMHRGYYPLSDFQAFRRTGPPQTEPGPDGRPPDNRHPMDKVIPKLAEQLPLRTPEWTAWSANMRAPKLEGRWALSAYEPGKGPIYGEFAIHATDKPDEFLTTADYVEARNGGRHRREGRSLVYTGFQWRGRSAEGGDKNAMREVMSLDRNQREITGRWFTGGYDEIGMDVTLTRVGADPLVLGTDRMGLESGGTHELQIFGANFPASVSAGTIDFGHGVTVKKVDRVAPGILKAEVEVAKDALVGPRDLSVAGAVRERAAMVYDHIDAIRVTPQAGMARVGGVNFPKQFQQFEATAWHNGPDGKPNTKDDFELGPVAVKWGIEEYTATFDDNDKDFVGTIDAGGLFTPNVDGPNPKRKGNGNNVGDVWVVATFQTPDGKTLRGRAHLLVTVPLYVRYDHPEGAR